MKRITLVSLICLFFISGCFGENVKKESQIKEVNTAKTEAAVKGNDKLIQPPNNTNTNAPTYHITVEKGATINSPLLPPQPAPPPAEMKSTPPAVQESSIERGIKDNSSNKSEEKSSRSVQSGWFYLIVAVAFCIGVVGLIALKLSFKKEIAAAAAAKDVALSGVESAVNFIKDELAWTKPETPEHGMAERAQIKLEGVAKLLGEAFKKK